MGQVESRSNSSFGDGGGGGKQFKSQQHHQPSSSSSSQTTIRSSQSLSSLNKNSNRRNRTFSHDSTRSADDPWGWFEDFENDGIGGGTPNRGYGGGDGGYLPHEAGGEGALENDMIMMSGGGPLTRAASLPPPFSEPPVYVLEATLATQHLWHSTAGKRPAQPKHEREYFEKLWTKNFETSSVEYASSSPSQESKSKSLGYEEAPEKKEFPGEVLYRGKGPFSNAVSKSFPDHIIASMTLQLPRFRVVQYENGEVHAEYLVVVSLGGSHGTRTFGVWRRYSAFQTLARQVRAVCGW